MMAEIEDHPPIQANPSDCQVASVEELRQKAAAAEAQMAELKKAQSRQSAETAKARFCVSMLVILMSQTDPVRILLHTSARMCTCSHVLIHYQLGFLG